MFNAAIVRMNGSIIESGEIPIIGNDGDWRCGKQTIFFLFFLHHLTYTNMSSNNYYFDGIKIHLRQTILCVCGVHHWNNEQSAPSAVEGNGQTCNTYLFAVAIDGEKLRQWNTNGNDIVCVRRCIQKSIAPVLCSI